MKKIVLSEFQNKIESGTTFTWRHRIWHVIGVDLVKYHGVWRTIVKAKAYKDGRVTHHSNFILDVTARIAD